MELIENIEVLDRLKKETGARTDAELARKLGIAKSKISAIRRGEYGFSLRVLQLIKEKTGIDFTGKVLPGRPQTGGGRAGGPYQTATLPARVEDAGGQVGRVVHLIRSRDADGVAEHCLERIRAMAKHGRWRTLEVMAELLDRLAESRQEPASRRQIRVQIKGKR